MNRFQFLFSQVDGIGQEIVYLIDTTDGQVYKTIVKVLGQQMTTVAAPVFKPFVPPTSASTVTTTVAPVAIDPEGELETPAQREARLKTIPKVPAAFMPGVSQKPPAE